jgi:hypothetical protein
MTRDRFDLKSGLGRDRRLLHLDQLQDAAAR